MTDEKKPFDRENETLNERLDVDFVLKAVRLGVWELDPATNLINWDRQCQELFGLTESESLPYEQVIGHVHPDDAARVDQAVRWAMNPRSGGKYDTTCRTIGAVDGVLRWVRSVGQSYFNEAGNVIRFAGVAQDITEDVQTRQETQSGEIHFRSLIEEAPMATALFVGRELIIEAANDLIIRYWGKDASVVGKPLAVALPELEGQPFLQILDAIFTTGEAYTAKAAPADIAVNGVLSTYYFDFTYKPIRNAAGEVYAILDMAVDVTEEVKARRKLEASEMYFRQLTDTVPAILWITEPDGHCSYLNKQWYDYTGQTRAEAEGFGWLDATHPDDKDEAGRRFVEANEKKSPFSALYRLRTDDGRYRWAIDRGSPRFGADGTYEGMIGTVVDIHDQKLAEEAATRFRYMAENASDAFILMREDGTFAYLNKLALERWGYTAEEATRIRVPDVDLVYSEDLFKTAFISAQTGKIPPFETLHKRKDGTIYPVEVNMGGLLLGQQPYLFAVARDSTDRKKADDALKMSEARLRSVIANAPTAIGLFVGRDLVVETPNQAFIDIVGKGSDITGKPLREVMPELESQAFLQILDDVYTSGTMFQSFGSQVNIVQQGVMTHKFYNITYTPIVDADGHVYAILDIAIDVTEQIQARQTLEESELFAYSIIENSPVANAVFVGQNMVIRTVNENMLAMLGRDVSIIGKPFMVAMPELVSTPLLDRLRHVLATGETYEQPEEKIDLVKMGRPYSGFYNYIYKALRNSAGDHYGVIVTATEVTEQVLARQKIEAAEANLRNAIELAKLGTWSMDIGKGTFTYSKRFMNWLGFSATTKAMDDTYDPLPDEYKRPVAEAIAAAIKPGSSGFYENEHPIINRLTGQVRIIHAQGQVFYDAAGKPGSLSGTAQDVTEQRKIQLALEHKVQERTEELAAINEELAATNEEVATTNEELAATNEELTESNQLLIRSNENLQQFAYIASHDLQEPLRKIQSFGDILKTRYADQLGEGVDHLERMQAAASRMSTLIRDLLTFSRISTQQDTTELVALTQVANDVLTDLDLRIQETGAVIDLEPLPTVAGDPLQLGQLFQNLLSNALKFRQPDRSAGADGTPPRIRVSAHLVAFHELPLSVNPVRQTAAYYRIDVADNGIGFDDKYVDRIFQVFQRLHGKSEFAGTGIGLAICAKVAANHGGAITASSQPGRGATFSIYFPQ